MRRSSGGGIGSFSSGGSNPNVKRNAAATRGLTSVEDTIKRLTRDSNSCQVVFDFYDECVKSGRNCDYERELKEKCNRFKRDPRRESVFERHRKWKESTQREAAAAGFDDMFDYIIDKHSKNPSFCRASYRLYKECISRDPTDPVCDVHRHKNCKEYFRS